MSEQQLSQLQNTLTKLNSQVQSLSDQQKSIQRHLDSVDAKLEIVNAVASKASAPAASQEAVKPVVKKTGDRPAVSMANAKPEAVKTVPVKPVQPVRSSERPTSPATIADVPTSKAWILKAAQPGKAMVSKPGSSEIYNVSIGDQLSGIGTVKDINYKDGRWAIEGTEAQIIR